ncbi:MAG: esterase [Gemmataceae bacterium]|nr:esterase [Gemmataceae bacterium]
MHRSYHRWHSPALGRDMELLVFGHAGARVLGFPASMHPFHDWEDRGLVGSIGWHLERGHFQLFCLDQVDRESWYGWHRHPADRARRYQQYDEYLVREVVPFTWSLNRHPFLVAAGPSMGAYHAVNFALRHPELAGRALGMSGLYDITRFTDGYHDANIYFNNPLEYLANEGDPARLAALRRLDIILAVGRDDPLLGQNERLSSLLWGNDVWHALRVWDGFAHDWPVWARMLPLYIGGHD